MKKIERKAFCPLDGWPTEQTLELTSESQSSGDYTVYKVEPVPTKTYYYVAKCKECHGLLLYSAENEDVEENFPKAELLWPPLPLPSEHVPETVTKYYLKALKFMHNEPDIFANQIRRALEAICKDKGIKPNGLNKRIEKLAEQEQSPIIGGMLDALRKSCNPGAHDDHIEPEYVPTVERFFLAVMNYLYVMPAELNEFERQLDLPKNE